MGLRGDLGLEGLTVAADESSAEAALALGALVGLLGAEAGGTGSAPSMVKVAAASVAALRAAAADDAAATRFLDATGLREAELRAATTEEEVKASVEGRRAEGVLVDLTIGTTLPRSAAKPFARPEAGVGMVSSSTGSSKEGSTAAVKGTMLLSAEVAMSALCGTRRSDARMNTGPDH